MSASATDALALLTAHGQAVGAYFQQLIKRFPSAPPRLMESIEYSVMAGGKRLRPALILETARACSRDHAANSSALAAAAAMELIHTFSLVHDDLPAMDNDDLRRGRPTNHKVFGEAMAILAGDAMVTLAFEVLATDAQPAVVAPLVRELSHSAGPEGMIGGQVLDMDGENRSLALPELRRLHAMKTGALLTASCKLGAISAGATESQLTAVGAFGAHLGVAFQIVDDLLDVTSTPEQMGKATGKDAAKGKNTYPTLLGLDESKKLAKFELQSALDALSHFDGHSQGLLALARFVVDRDK